MKMNKPQIIKLTPDEVTHISSDYIREGRLHESWKINEITISDKNAFMDVSMTATYPPESDNSHFHLSIYLAEEMASQLMIIYGHIWAELTEKKEQVWMLESHTKSIKAVTNTEHIKVEMDVQTMRKRGKTIYGIGKYQISDDRGGLIKLEQKGVLA